MNLPRVVYLIEQYSNGHLTTAEQAEWEALLQSDPEGTVMKQALEQMMEAASPAHQLDVAHWEMLAEKIISVDKVTITAGKQSSPVIRSLKTTWWRYAAAIILFAGIGAWLWTKNRPQQEVVKKQEEKPLPQEIVVPGSNKAILTLSNGSTVQLTPNAKDIEEAGTNIKNNGSALAYGKADSILFNTLSTPRGGQYQLTLSDGTRIWLNAASSITFPTAFTGHERSVQVTGEVYFEVAKNVKMPFKVNLNDGTAVEVLGTHFNINAYTDEDAIATTLLEGAVRIRTTRASQILKPGQQAQLYGHEKINVINQADVGQVMAWKNGYFNFNKMELPAVMRQLERWYDITVTWEGPVPALNFKGEMDRGVQLAGVLRILSDFNIKGTLRGRTLVLTAIQ